MTIDEVYEKYKHMDPVLSDKYFAEGIAGRILHDLWQAVKDEQLRKHRGVNDGNNVQNS